MLGSENSVENQIDLVPVLLESYGGGGARENSDITNITTPKDIITNLD